MTWVLADDHDSTVAANDLALVANLLDARVYLHVSYFFSGLLLAGLFVAVSNSATRQVIGTDLYKYAVSEENTDVVLTHFARNSC